MKKIVCFAATLALVSQTALALQFTTYTTKNNSTLELQVNQDNTITGFYTMARDIAARICSGITEPRKVIVGTSIEDTVNFTVNYPECNKNMTLGGKLESGNVFRVTSIRITSATLAIDESNLI